MRPGTCVASRLIRAGVWLTKRRRVLLAPIFSAGVVGARWAPSAALEVTRDLAGLALLAGGVWLRLVAASYHERTHREPITAGPYAWVRHPLYLANFLLGFGVLLVAGGMPILLVYSALFWLVHALIMQAEEAEMARRHPAFYGAYRRAVPAVVPSRPYGGRQYGRQSTIKLRTGHEGWKVLGYGAALVGILLWKQALGFLPPARSWPALPGTAWMVGLALCLGTVIIRPRTRRGWLRHVVMAAAILGGLLAAQRVPGVWPPRP